MDPSQASINVNQFEQTETIICMDLKYYNAATEGKIEVFKDIIDHQSLDLLLTPIKNTILHIYITTLNSKSKSIIPNAGSESTTSNVGSKSTTNFVKEILKMCPSLLWKANAGSKSTTTLNARSESTTTISVGSESTTNFVEEILNICPSLLWKANAKGETLFHIAARYGHVDIVEVLIKYCAQTLFQDLEGRIEPVKVMLRMTNKEKNTALHEAIRYNHFEVVKLLIREDSDYSYSANDADETPLYIAAERQFQSVVFEILDKCKSPMHVGPLGRTALHAAVIGCGEGMISGILKRIEGISREVDNNGCTPLHLAAAYLDYSNSVVGMLLTEGKEIAYMKDIKGRTAIHIAAQYGNVFAMESMVSRCPACWEQVDDRGWNICHFAMKDDLSDDIIKIILKNSYLNNLLDEKNFDGATPLDFYSYSLASPKNFFAISKRNKKMLEIRRGGNRPPGQPPILAITYEDDTITTKPKDEDDKDRKRRPMLVDAAEAHLVVAALITTVTFAACITMPGGFAGAGEGSHPGSALLRRSAAFKAFVIIDTISMLFSSCAVFIHLLTPFRFGQKEREDFVFLAFRFILGAMVAMVLAFVTGTYAVLMPSLNISIANCITGLTFFAILFLVFRKFIGSTFFRLLVYVLLRID